MLLFDRAKAVTAHCRIPRSGLIISRSIDAGRQGAITAVSWGGACLGELLRAHGDASLLRELGEGPKTCVFFHQGRLRPRWRWTSTVGQMTSKSIAQGPEVRISMCKPSSCSLTHRTTHLSQNQDRISMLQSARRAAVLSSIFLRHCA
jgi:hypothetical protein